MIAAINKFRKQLFAKLLLIFFVTGTILIALLASGIHFVNTDTDTPFKQFTGNISQYTKYLVADIGQPPNLEAINRISTRTGLGIHIEGRSQTWQSTEIDLGKIRNMHYQPLETDSHIEFAHRHGVAVLKLDKEIDQQHYRYYFIAEHLHGGKNWTGIFLLSVLITLCVLGGTYFSVRHLFKPIRQLGKASQEIANGKLDTVVTTNSTDELGELADNFNYMVSNINNLIQSKDQLLLDVSHELRSPLTRIKVATEMLTEHKFADSIRTDVRLLEHLISEILDSARLRHGKELGQAQFETIELDTLLQSLIDELKDITPGIDFTPGNCPCRIYGNTTQMEIALRNIIENALKYSDQQNRPVEITINNLQNKISISVRDYGIGIASEDEEKIFEPFSRLDSARNHNKPGFGLGLSISKSIIDLHSGHISVSRKSDTITEFLIELPAQRDS